MEGRHVRLRAARRLRPPWQHDDRYSLGSLQATGAAERPAVLFALGRGDPARTFPRPPDLAPAGHRVGVAGDRGAPRAHGRRARHQDLMSRTARATIGALFGYARFTVSLIGGLWLVPFSIRHVGTNLYGLWLASGELIAYAGLMELGVLVTLPWLVAQADGRGDRGRMRDLVATGGAAALLAATIIAVISAALWLSMPRLLHLRPADQHALLGPVLIVAIVGAVANPLRVFSCVLEGLQDVRFNGAVQLCQAVVSLGLTFALLRGGYGLYALAVAVTLPQLIGGLWAVLRVRAIAPD